MGLRKAKSVLCILLSAAVSVPVFSQTSEEQQPLWDDLVRQYKNPDEKIFDGWNVVVDVPLVKTAKGISSGHAAAASVLLYLDSSGIDRYPVGRGRFSQGDMIIFNAILGHFSEVRENSDFVSMLQGLYTSRIKQLDSDSGYQEGLSKGQSLAERLVKRSGNPEKAIQSYLEDRFYRPASNTEITPDCAKAFIDCGIPFVLTSGKKYFVCIGYVEKNGKSFFLIVDNEAVEQDECSRNDLGRKKKKDKI